MSAPAVVITGGAGFLGSHLSERLLADGYEVVCVDNFLTSHHGNLATVRAHKRFSLVVRDVTSLIGLVEPLGGVVSRVGYVMHLASPASPVDYARCPLETLAAGAEGTRAALELARVAGAVFLLASTSEVYGDPEVHPQPESYFGRVNPVGPRSCYDEAKRFAEALTTAYRQTRGVSTRIARIFNTYGERMRPNDGRVVSTFLRQVLTGEPLTIHGAGTQTRSLCHVSDMVDGLVRLLLSAEEHPVNLGNPEEVTVLELARRVKQVVGRPTLPPKFIARPAEDPERRCPDIRRARELLNWQPRVALDEGLRRTANFLEQQLLQSGRTRPPQTREGEAP